MAPNQALEPALALVHNEQKYAFILLCVIAKPFAVADAHLHGEYK
jgi:hypothetical protein